MTSSIRTDIARKLFLFGTLPFLVVGVVLSWLTYSDLREDILAQQMQRVVTVAKLLENALDGKLFNAKSTVEATALRIDGLQDWSPVLQTYILRNPDVVELSLFDANGRKLLRVNRDLLVSEGDGAPSELAQITEEISRNGHPKVIRIEKEATTGEPTMTVATPFMDPLRKRLEFVLLSRHRLTSLSHMLSELPSVQGTTLYLLDTKQHILAHQNPSVTLRENVHWDATIVAADPGHLLRGLNGQLALVNVHPIALGDRTLTVVAEHRIQDVVTRNMRSFLGAVILLIFSIALPLVLRRIVSDRIVTPVEGLSTAAQNIAGGNHTVKVRSDRNDELGALAKTFNEMASKVELELAARKKTETALRENERLLDDGIQALPVGFAYFNSDGALVRFNERYRTFLPTTGHLLEPGLTFERLIQNSATVVAQRAGYDNEEDYVRDRLASMEAGQVRVWTHHQSTDRWVAMTEHPATAGGFISIIEDITEERDSEEKLRQAQRMESIGQLTGGVAHDFNNLLAVILGNAELLLDNPDNDPERIDEILKATKRGADLTRRLLAFARKQPLMPKQVDYLTLVAGMKDMLVRTLGATIDIEVIAQPGLWTCRADPGQVEDALLNLAINARDAMPDGGKLTIECANATLDSAYVSSHPELLPGEYAMIAVTDTGSGMSEEVRVRAFEPFYTTKGLGQGTGLGLSMIFGFAKQSGGHVAIYSEVGTGTTVRIYLPRNQAPHVPEEPTEKTSLTQGNGETILIIEDDPLVGQMAELTITSLGYVPVLAKHAQAAREMIDGGLHYDVILSDVVLPGGISGPEFADEMRDKDPDVRIIFMSGYPAESAKRNGFVGSDRVLLNKPFKMSDLAAALRDAVAQK